LAADVRSPHNIDEGLYENDVDRRALPDDVTLRAEHSTGNVTELFKTEETCVTTPVTELERQSNAGDISASHVLGLIHFGDNYDFQAYKNAEPYFRKGADQHYPPSLYWYWMSLTVQGKHNGRHFPLL